MAESDKKEIYEGKEFYAEALKIAINVCTTKLFAEEAFMMDKYEDKRTPQERKEVFDEIVARVAVHLIKEDLEEYKKEMIIGITNCIAFRMYAWITYHIGTYNLPQEFCVYFLNPSHFTDEGLINYQKVARDLEKSLDINRDFSTLQKFQLACMNCDQTKVTSIFRTLKKEDLDKVYNAESHEVIKQPDLVKFWSYTKKTDIKKLKKEKSVNQCKLESAIKSGSLVGVEVCLRKEEYKEKVILAAAVEVIKHRMQIEMRSKIPNSGFVDDWVIFREEPYNSSEESWTPTFFLADIFYALILKLSPPKTAEIFKELFKAAKQKGTKSLVHTKALEHFVCWPHHEVFTKLITISSVYLPEVVYGGLLLELADRMETEYGHYYHGESKFCGYNKILIDVWYVSPVTLKVYAFKEKRQVLRNQEVKIIKEAKDVLVKIYSLKYFMPLDRENAITILNSVPYKQRQNFLLSSDGTAVCVMMLVYDRIDMFEELASTCFQDPEDALQFRKAYSFMHARKRCLDLIKENKWDEVESVLRWSPLSAEEEKALKREIILSPDGIQTCGELCNLFFDTSVQLTNKVANAFIAKTVDWKPIESIFSWAFLGQPFLGVRVANLKTIIRETAKEQILLRFILSNKTLGAARFLYQFSDSDCDQVTKLKEDRFFHSKCAYSQYISFVESEDDDLFFGHSREKALELYLKFYLTNLESLNKLKSYSDCFKSNKTLQKVFELVAKHLKGQAEKAEFSAKSFEKLQEGETEANSSSELQEGDTEAKSSSELQEGDTEAKSSSELQEGDTEAKSSSELQEGDTEAKSSSELQEGDTEAKSSSELQEGDTETESSSEVEELEPEAEPSDEVEPEAEPFNVQQTGKSVTKPTEDAKKPEGKKTEAKPSGDAKKPEGKKTEAKPSGDAKKPEGKKTEAKPPEDAKKPEETKTEAKPPEDAKKPEETKKVAKFSKKQKRR